MRNSVMISALIHVAITLGVFLLPRMRVIVPGPDVVQVALIEPGAAPEPAPAAAPAPPPPPEDEGIRIEPKKTPRTETRKPEPPRPEPPRPKPQESAAPPSSRTTIALPSARIGPAGLRGEVGVDNANFEFAYYLALVRDRIAQNWSPPGGIPSGRTVRAVVYFRIARGGSVSGIQLESPSGVEFFDRAGMRAVMLSHPMPPLPLGFGGGDLGVHFGFEWEAP
jgi:outer membrane biosynthesis protein TonB